MISLAIVAMVAATAAMVMSRGLRVQSDRLDRYWLNEFARSVSLEYVATYPAMAREGTAPGGWTWRIEERVAPSSAPTPEIPIQELEVTVTTWQTIAPDRTASVVAIMVRHAP